MKAKWMIWMFILFVAGSAFAPLKKTFEEIQRNFPRVKQAYERKEDYINDRCKLLGVSPQSFGNIFIRVFKQDKKLELWVQREDKKYVLFNEYKIYGGSGTLGPKRQEGDRQIPEGFYYINDFNPYSNYHLSLGINYPNESDRVLSTAARKGGDIYIHGSDVSIGCLAMSDYFIEDIYICAVKAKNQGQQKIPVHIYPFRLSPSNLSNYTRMEEFNKHQKIWWNLAQGYQFFEKKKRLPEISVNTQGYYDFSDPQLAQDK